MSAVTRNNEAIATPEAVVRVLEEAGVNVVFGMPGGHMLKIYDALYDHQDSIRALLLREESLAAIMAEVYGRLTGEPGVFIAQGAFSMSGGLLGVLEAHLAASPMVVMTDLGPDGAPYAHHAPYQSGTGAYGGWNAVRSFEAVSKETMVANDDAQAVQLTQLAFKHALDGNRGPVSVLYYGHSLSREVGPDTEPRIYPTANYLLRDRPAPSASQLDAAAKALVAAERPVILAGNGIRISQAYEALEKLAEGLGAAVVSTASGKGVLRETHPLSLGIIGNFGVPSANAALGAADLVLAIGTRMGATDTANENPALLNPERQTLVQVDIDSRNASWTLPADHVVIGDAKLAIEGLQAAIDAAGGVAAETLAERTEEIAATVAREGSFDFPGADSDQSPLLPQRVIHELQRISPEETMITCDAGENRLFMMRFFQTKASGTYVQPGASGGMGYAIPAAMACKVVHPERPAIAVCGDGGFAMAINGLISARELKLPITVVVLNNETLGWVYNGQKDRTIASAFDEFDYAAIARSMGCDGVRVETADQLAPALEAALASDNVSVVEVMTSRETCYRDIDAALAEQLA